MRHPSTTTKRRLAQAILAFCILLPSPASAQRRKPKPAPQPVPSATPAPAPVPTEAATTTTPAPAEASPPPASSAATPEPEPPAAPSPATPAPVTPAPAVETHVKPAPPPAPVVRRVTTPVVVSSVIAGLGLASGVVFAVLAAGDHSKYQQKPDHDVALSGEQSTFIADVSFGVAALFGFTALALYLLPDEPAPAEPAKAAKARPPTWVTSALKGEVLQF